jgi:DNA modification methylase
MRKASEQLALQLDIEEDLSLSHLAYRDRLISLLNSDLDFHNERSGYASHNFHSFPAKFPPQLPRKFINGLTSPGDVVLDPMMGSGTTILETLLANRCGVGLDIDPLALMIGKVKISPLNLEKVDRAFHQVVTGAKQKIQKDRSKLEQNRLVRWNDETKKFIDYWFMHDTQLELIALISEIEQVEDIDIKLFLKVAFSSIIITKSGGVSLAFDLAHTRPHRAKIILDQNGQEVFRGNIGEKTPKSLKLLTKLMRSPLNEFEKRYKNNLKGISSRSSDSYYTNISWGDAQNLPLNDASIDLIVTSPPYASNAIDYMRAHKFALVWLGYDLSDLSKKRKEYIGGESTSGVVFEPVPPYVEKIIHTFSQLDRKKMFVLHRYYSEMARVLKEMYRVIKPGKAAIVVVGSSIIRGVDIETQNCLAHIGREAGFEVPIIGVRKLDRNRRMLPAGLNQNLKSQIQQRMYEEYAIGFYKPEE